MPPSKEGRAAATLRARVRLPEVCIRPARYRCRGLRQWTGPRRKAGSSGKATFAFINQFDRRLPRSIRRHRLLHIVELLVDEFCRRGVMDEAVGRSVLVVQGF